MKLLIGEQWQSSHVANGLVYVGRHPDPRLTPLILAHELGHIKLRHKRARSWRVVQAYEIAAWLYAFRVRDSRRGIRFASTLLESYDVSCPLLTLREGCNRLGIRR